MIQWLLKNKVLIIGLLSAVALAISELIKGGSASIQVLVLSGFIAAASYLARNLRGQWATISGLFGNALVAYLTMLQSGHVQWSQLILQTLISLLAIFSSPAKSIGYEKSPAIVEAKKEGEIDTPTTASPNPPTHT